MRKNLLHLTVVVKDLGGGKFIAEYPKEGIFGGRKCFKEGGSREEVRKRALNAIYQRRWRKRLKNKDGNNVNNYWWNE